MLRSWSAGVERIHIFNGPFDLKPNIVQPFRVGETQEFRVMFEEWNQQAVSSKSYFSLAAVVRA